MDFKPPPIPRRPRPQRPSYAPVTARELLLDGGFKDCPGLPVAEAEPGAIVRSPSGEIVPQPRAAIVHQPKGLAVHQNYPVYATPGFISSERKASKTWFVLRMRFFQASNARRFEFPKFKLPQFSKWRLPKWKCSTPNPTAKPAGKSQPKPQTTSPTTSKKPTSQAGKAFDQLAVPRLPKPAFSGGGFGSKGLGKSRKLGGKGGADNFGDDPIAQLLVKIFLVLLILIPLIL